MFCPPRASAEGDRAAVPARFSQSSSGGVYTSTDSDRMLKIKRGGRNFSTTPIYSQACKPSSVLSPLREMRRSSIWSRDHSRDRATLPVPILTCFSVGVSRSWIGTYLVLLRVEIASFHPTSPFNTLTLVGLRRAGPLGDLGPAKSYRSLDVEGRSRLVSVALP